ncbi:hypothetical protein H6H01_15625 [Nostoc calcicola FACHB-3891]|nr:hypothetical protein [Nostoc calcicola FACHB-3891]
MVHPRSLDSDNVVAANTLIQGNGLKEGDRRLLHKGDRLSYISIITY